MEPQSQGEAERGGTQQATASRTQRATKSWSKTGRTSGRPATREAEPPPARRGPAQFADSNREPSKKSGRARRVGGRDPKAKTAHRTSSAVRFVQNYPAPNYYPAPIVILDLLLGFLRLGCGKPWREGGRQGQGRKAGEGGGGSDTGCGEKRASREESNPPPFDGGYPDPRGPEHCQ